MVDSTLFDFQGRQIPVSSISRQYEIILSCQTSTEHSVEAKLLGSHFYVLAKKLGGKELDIRLIGTVHAPYKRQITISNQKQTGTVRLIRMRLSISPPACQDLVKALRREPPVSKDLEIRVMKLFYSCLS